MSSSSRELVFLILQFLDEEKFKETVHKLEKESGFFFNMSYFEDAVTNGEWEELENYISGFTKVDDNRYSMKIFFELRKQKYLEALDKGDHAKAVEILTKDLKVFSTFDEDLYKEMISLLASSFRENEQLSKYGDANSARAIMLAKLKKLIEANPVFRDKLQFPTMVKSRLRTLVNWSLNRQQQPNSAHVPFHVPPMGGPSPFQHGGVPLTNSLAGWMAAPPSLPHQAIPVGPMGLTPPNIPASIEKRTRSPPTNNPTLDYQTADSEHMFKRSRSFRVAEEGHNVLVNILPIGYPGAGQSRAHSMYSVDDLPKNVVANFNQGSAVKSMDFHPAQQTLLLVGTNIGDISLWDVSSGRRLRSGKFKVRNLGNCSMKLQACFANGNTASVNRVRWSPDGRFFGVAYSKHIFHFLEFSLKDVFIKPLYQADAHIGSVNDLAFSNPNKQLRIITCGEDKTVKVWDAATGATQYIFKGHEASVYSVCPHSKENIQVIYSTAVDGKIKAWLYDNTGSRVDYDAPGHSCTTMAYSADGTRLFCCGTNKEGESHIVEWNERAGAVKRAYFGLGKCSVGVVQFDTTRNRLLAAGDEFTVKYWDMDNVNLLSSVDADGGLLATPCVRFNKEGMLLAVSTSENGVKILANAEGVRLVRSIENRAGTTSKASIMSTSWLSL